MQLVVPIEKGCLQTTASVEFQIWFTKHASEGLVFMKIVNNSTCENGL